MGYKFYGTDTVSLAEKYGTPLYLMSEDYIVDRCAEIREDFLGKYDNTFAVYAGKAFSTKEMCRIINREGLGLDVVSGGEIYTALSVDFPAEKIIFHGNNKSESELKYAIEEGVGRIIVDNVDELYMIKKLSEKYSKKVKILFRLTPGVDSYTHEYISTGHLDSKFGISLDDDILYNAIKTATAAEYIDLAGFHFHVGSQLSDNSSHLKAVAIFLGIMKELKSKLDFDTHEVNVGGGFGIHYSDDEVRKPVAYFTDPIMALINDGCAENDMVKPLVIIEPGRWIVGEAGVTLYSIGTIKRAEGMSTYVGIDGGMPDNPRPSLYQAKYEAIIANKFDQENTDTVTIAGKCCESGDILIKGLKVPKPEYGDILLVSSTGAYNYSMSNNYNKLPIPAVVMVKSGQDREIVKRQSYADMINLEL